MICSFKEMIYPRSTEDTEKGSYMIVKYKVDEKVLNTSGAPITEVKVVGYHLPIAVGIQLDLNGRWKKDPQYGMQYELESYREVVVPTREGIIAYLSSGLIKGIGSEIAGRIYAHFGKETLDVLDTQPEKLMEVSGIKKLTLQSICDSYMASRNARDVVALLVPHGVTANRAVKIYKAFGNDAVGIIRRHPYRLSEMEGIGFITADSIAMNLGLDSLSPERISAGILYTLKDAEMQGHLCLHKDKLTKRCIKLLQTEGLTEKMAAQEAFRLLGKGAITLYQDNVYRSETAQAEKDVAEQLKKLVICGEIAYPMQFDSEIDRVQKAFKLKLAGEQRSAVKVCITSHICIVSGSPGTGKTLIQKVLLDIYRRARPDAKILCCAPTGRAARRMSECTGYPASTIHKVLGLRPEDDIETTMPELLEADFVLVDEVSMLDIHLARLLLMAIPRNCQLILVGDADQLPSAGPGAVLREMIACNSIPVVTLDKVFRQDAGSRIATNAKRIRHGDTSLDYGDDFMFFESANFANSADMLESLYVDEVKRVGIDNVALLTPYRKKTETSVSAMNERLRARVNPPHINKSEITVGRKLFREGDKVMQIKNSEEINNGDIGRITSISTAADETTVVVDFGDERIAEYTQHDMDMLELGYASTVHKSQGSEYMSVLINFQKGHYIMLKRPIVYTAITRAKQRAILVGEKKALHIAIDKVDAEKRGTMLATRINEGCPKKTAVQKTKGVLNMATMLENYATIRTELDKLISSAAITPEQVWQYQELLYRIEVLETSQMFIKTVPQSMDTKVIILHYQMVDSFVQSLTVDRRSGVALDENGQKQRNTTASNLSMVITDYRKRFGSFVPDSPGRYSAEIAKVINTVLPAWLTYRNTFVEINKIKEVV